MARPQRTFWHSDVLDNPDAPDSATDQEEADGRHPVDTIEESNLISSLTDHDGIHMPVLDIDMPCELRPSSTPGHFHLLIDLPMHWDHYQALIEALATAGVIQEGYARASLRRGATFVRTNHTKPKAT